MLKENRDRRGYKCAGVHVQADTHTHTRTDEDRAESNVVNGRTGSWKVK